jgi:hypothetical protein
MLVTDEAAPRAAISFVVVHLTDSLIGAGV